MPSVGHVAVGLAAARLKGIPDGFTTWSWASLLVVLSALPDVDVVSTAISTDATVTWCYVRDPEGKRKPCNLSSTDLSMSPKTIIEIFSKRWSIEQMFSDAKNELGLDTAEVRCPASVVRHAVIAADQELGPATEARRDLQHTLCRQHAMQPWIQRSEPLSLAATPGGAPFFACRRPVIRPVPHGVVPLQFRHLCSPQSSLRTAYGRTLSTPGG